MSMKTRYGKLTEEGTKSGSSGRKEHQTSRDRWIIHRFAFLEGHIVRHQTSRGGVSVSDHFIYLIFLIFLIILYLHSQYSISDVMPLLNAKYLYVCTFHIYRWRRRLPSSRPSPSPGTVMGRLKMRMRTGQVPPMSLQFSPWRARDLHWRWNQPTCGEEEEEGCYEGVQEGAGPLAETDRESWCVEKTTDGDGSTSVHSSAGGSWPMTDTTLPACIAVFIKRQKVTAKGPLNT